MKLARLQLWGILMKIRDIIIMLLEIAVNHIPVKQTFREQSKHSDLLVNEEFPPVLHNCKCIPWIAEWGEVPAVFFMTDDEKIDHHETKRIFKLYGVEEESWK